MTDSPAVQPTVEPSYCVLDDRVGDPDAFATDPSDETNHVPQSMSEQRGDRW